MKLLSVLTSPQGSLVLLFVLFLIGGLLNYYGNNPRILYAPLFGFVLLILYLGHIYIQNELSAKEGREKATENKSPEIKPSHISEPVEAKPTQPISEPTKPKTDNGKTKMEDKKPAKKIEKSVIQTMTNSPGSVQVGGDVNIHHEPQPRRLTGRQHDWLLNTLTQGPKGSFEINFLVNDNESKNFAEQLESVLKEAGWQAGTGAANMDANAPIGILIILKNENCPRAAFLQRALKEIGFSAPGKISSSNAEDSVILYVGSKP